MSATTFVRPDGKEKVTGTGRYTADVTLTGQLHAKLRYADHTHARILRIDTTKARALPGVFAVLTHEDVPDVLYGAMVKDRRLFAKERVRFEADIVAAVAALTPEIAAEAAALIEVEYEPLHTLTHPEAAMHEEAPLVHANWRGDEADERLERNGNVLSRTTIVKGDAAAALGTRFIPFHEHGRWHLWSTVGEAGLGAVAVGMSVYVVYLLEIVKLANPRIRRREAEQRAAERREQPSHGRESLGPIRPSGSRPRTESPTRPPSGR